MIVISAPRASGKSSFAEHYYETWVKSCKHNEGLIIVPSTFLLSSINPQINAITVSTLISSVRVENASIIDNVSMIVMEPALMREKEFKECFDRFEPIIDLIIGSPSICKLNHFNRFLARKEVIVHEWE